MSDLWKLECTARWVGMKTFAELGLEFASFRKASRVPDVMELSRVAAVDAADLLEFKDWVTVWRGDVRFFQGNVTQLPRAATDVRESGSYEISGPRWWMAQLPAIAAWKSDGADPEATVDRSRIIYEPGSLADPKTTGEFASDLIDLMVAAGIPVQKGTILAGFQMVRFATSGTYWADALDSIYSIHPDAIERFDYATSPPTIHITKRSAMSSIDISLGEVDSPNSLSFQPRYDLRPDRVRLINYATKLDEILGSQRILDQDTYEIVPDATPPVRELVIDLGRKAIPQGQTQAQFAATWLAQRVRTRTIPQAAADAGCKEWWVDHIQGLARHKPILDLSKLFVAAADAKVELEGKREDGVIAHNVEVLNDGIPDAPPIKPGAPPPPPGDPGDYPRELLDGSIEEWMGVRTARLIVAASIGYEAATIEAIANDAVRADFKALFPRRFKSGSNIYYYNTFSVQVTGTNAQTKVYRAPASATFTPASSTPENSLLQNLNLAENYAAGLAELHWSGTFTVIADEAGESEYLGSVINIIGGDPRWQTMRALVQGVDIDIEGGATTVTVGPPDQAAFTALEDQEATVPESSTVTYDYATDQSQQASAAGGYATAAFSSQAQAPALPILGPAQLSIQRVRFDGSTPKITFAAATMGEANEEVVSLDHPIVSEAGELDGETEIALVPGEATQFWLKVPTNQRGGIDGTVQLLKTDPSDAQPYYPPSPEGSPQVGRFKFLVYTVTAPPEVGGVWQFKPGSPVPVWTSYRWVGQNIGSGEGEVYKRYNNGTRRDEFRTLKSSGDAALEEDGEECRVKVIKHADEIEIKVWSKKASATPETPP